MPTISVFHGIVISMFFNGHDPPQLETDWRLAQQLRPLLPIEPLA